MRDATETYLELGQRIPIYLNGEIQIAWVLEQGLLDMAFVARTFGITEIRRDKLVKRGPRFHIAFDANAFGRDNQTTSATSDTNRSDRLGRVNFRDSFVSSIPGNNASLFSGLAGTSNQVIGNVPASEGRYELMRCKVDSVSLGIMPGRRVAAVRWEGVCEGITFVKDSIQDFQSQVSAIGGGNPSPP